MAEVTGEDIKIAEIATLYELRLLISQGEKEEYTRTEILDLLDKIALARMQE